VSSSYYRNENPVISHFITDDEIHISTSKKADGYFALTNCGSSQLEIIDGDLIKQDGQRITFKSFVKMKKPLNINRINVKYVDETNQEWFVFSNYELKSKEFENIKQETEKRKKVRFNQIHYTIS
jgi:hypothetical protein